MFALFPLIYWNNSRLLGREEGQYGMQFDELLKKQSVTLEESSRICRGAPASGDSPIDGYWSCLCDKPLLRNTGRSRCLTLHSALYRPSLCSLTTHTAAAHRARFSPRMPRPVASAFQLHTRLLHFPGTR